MIPPEFNTTDEGTILTIDALVVIIVNWNEVKFVKLSAVNVTVSDEPEVAVASLNLNTGEVV